MTPASSAPSLSATQSITRQYLSFGLPPDVRALLPTQQLTEILQLGLEQIIPIPDVDPQIMGVCNWRGEVLWLVDLGYMLGFQSLFASGFHHSSYSAIVIQHSDKALGLVVDHVTQMLWLDPQQIQMLVATPVQSDLSRTLQGYYLNPQGETFWVLDSSRLMEFSHP